MEIRLSQATYCLNPRRIIYIEYFLADKSDPYSSNKITYSPDIPQSKLDEIKDIPLAKHIRIKMTDNEEIMFCTNDDNCYNEIKEKMEKIIGG